MVDNNKSWWDIAKQVPALAVLTILTYLFLTQQQEQASQFTKTLDAIQREHNVTMLRLAEECHQVQRESIGALAVNSAALTRLIETLNR